MTESVVPTSTHTAPAAGQRGEPAVSEEPRRLHSLTLLLGVVRLVPQSLNMLPVIVGLGFAGGRQWIVPAIIAWAVGSLAIRIWAWRRFSWTVDADDVTITSGILSRQVRTIPFDRIQDVTIEQGMIARLFGLAKVGFETGSSGGDKKDEGTLDSIALGEAEWLRDYIRLHRSGVAVRATDAVAPVAAEQSATPAAARVESDDRTLFVMTPSRLIMAGLFNFSLAVFAVLFGLLQTFDDILPFDPFSVRFWENLVEGTTLESWVVAHRWLSVVGGALTLLLLGFATGIVRTFLRDWGYRLDRSPRGFRRRRGLTTRTDVAIPIARVQAAVVRTGWVRRLMGWYSLQVESLASDSGDEGGDHVVAPFARLTEIDPILCELALDRAGLEEGIGAGGWQRSHASVIWTPVVGALCIALLVFSAIFGVEHIMGEPVLDRAPFPVHWVLPFVPLFVALIGWISWRRRLWHFDGRLLHVADGITSPRHTILPARHVQSADLTIGPLQRRLGTASLTLGVPGGVHSIESIPMGSARALRAAVLAAR
jgi:putative membrane protein